jgi:hypothetical protein
MKLHLKARHGVKDLAGVRQPAVRALDEVVARLPRIYSQIENNVSTEV